MNREIKFRAWNLGDKRMVEFDLEDLMYGTHKLETVDLKYWTVMQYTGLKDKNGKEIYEGDIIFDEDGEYSKTCIIDWNYESGGFFGKALEDDDTYSMVEIDGEVIGNIYENADLIK